MNPTTYRNPGRAAARAFAAMALAATSFLVPGAAHADEATAGTEATNTATNMTTEASTSNAADATADAATSGSDTTRAETTGTDTADAATTSSEADATTCAVMRTAPAGTTATLDRGHADIFDLTSDAAGALTLRIKEDATGSGVMREPEQTLLAVNKSTLTQIPASVRQATGAPSAAYLLGQTGDNQASVLWPGWDTLGIAAGGYDTDTAQLPADAHQHMSWAFTAPGVYRVHFRANLRTTPGATPTPVGEGTAVFAVGTPPEDIAASEGRRILNAGHADITVNLTTKRVELASDADALRAAQKALSSMTPFGRAFVQSNPSHSPLFSAAISDKIEGRIKAYTKWKGLVAAGCPWDHKKAIQRPHRR